MKRATRMSPFLALLEAEWSHAQLIRLLTHEDVVCLALMAIECDVEWLRHRLLHAPGPLQPISSRSLMQYAAIRGWWHHVALLIPNCRRWSCRYAPQSEYIDANDPATMDFSKCQRIQRRMPVKFDAEVMYAAAERGVLAEVAWLHRYTDYQAQKAIERTATACHVDVLEWLLDHQDTANKRSDQQTSQRFRIKLRQFESSLRATCWSDRVEKTAYCVMDGIGFLPPNPSNVELYQLMDWAAKEGKLAMLQRLHEDPIGTKTCSFLAMYHAAENGDLTMLQWLHKHRTERNDYMIAVLAAAVKHGHLAAMDWIRDAYFAGPMLQPVFATAVRAGQIDVVRQLATHFEDEVRALLRYRYSMPNNPEMVAYICEKLGYELAASDLEDVVWSGHHDVARWMVTRYRDKVLPHPESLTELLQATIKSGSIELVWWCVEDLGAWSSSAPELSARQGHIQVFRYLTTIAEDARRDQVEYSWSMEVALLRSDFHEASVKWLLEHFEEDAPDLVIQMDVEVLQASPTIRSPSLMRTFMRHRPRLCCHLPLYPLWVLRSGTLADLKMLQVIGHPALFTKKTLDYLLNTSRDDGIMKWFITHCSPTLVDSRVVSWCARYGVVEMLPSLLAIFQARHPNHNSTKGCLKFFGTTISSSARYEQISVLEWVEHDGYSRSNLLLKNHLFMVSAQRGCGRSLVWLLGKKKVGKASMDELVEIAFKYGHLKCREQLLDAIDAQCLSDDGTT